MDKGYIDYKFQVELERLMNNFCKMFPDKKGITPYMEYSDQWAIVLSPNYDEYGEISYNLLGSEEVDKLWTDLITQWFPDIHAPMFLWNFFHEIGHFMTNQHLSPIEEKAIRAYKDSLYLLNDDGTLDTESTLAYFCCKDEKMATAWAAAFMRKYPKTTKKFWKKAKKLLNKIYKYNTVDDLTVDLD